MHAIYTTPGFVIDSRPYGEAGKILFVFTRDLGLVPAIAQGIRLEKSKLRYFLQDYSFGTYSLVRGKEFWRLTSARESEIKVGNKSEIIGRISLLLRRLLQGEEAHPELFTCVESLSDFLGGNPDLTDDELKALETLSVFRILRNLGYVGQDEDLSAFINSMNIDRALLKKVAGKRLALNQHINKALKESHL